MAQALKAGCRRMGRLKTTLRPADPTKSMAKQMALARCASAIVSAKVHNSTERANFFRRLSGEIFRQGALTGVVVTRPEALEYERGRGLEIDAGTEGAAGVGGRKLTLG